VRWQKTNERAYTGHGSVLGRIPEQIGPTVCQLDPQTDRTGLFIAAQAAANFLELFRITQQNYLDSCQGYRVNVFRTNDDGFLSVNRFFRPRLSLIPLNQKSHPMEKFHDSK